MDQDHGEAAKGPVVRKKSNAGLIGFVLSLCGIITCGLAAIPGFIFCIIGIIRNSYRILACIGLVISSLCMMYLVAWTPPGTMPYPLSVAKYSINAPHFWVQYRFSDMDEVQSQYFFFGGSKGALYYKTDGTDLFEAEDVIKFARQNGWIYLGKRDVAIQCVDKYLDETGKMLGYDEFYMQFEDEETAEQEEYDFDFVALLRQLVAGGYPFWIKSDCSILSFDTNNLMPSYVIISKDGKQMAVYCDCSR